MTANSLARFLILVASAATSLSALARRCGKCPSDETLRQATLAQLPAQTADLRQRLIEAFHRDIPLTLRRKPLPVAIDLTLIPYYGKKNTPGIYHAAAKLGTKRFWAYATLVVIRRGRRFTLGLVELTNDDSLQSVVELLLDQMAQAGVTPLYVLLDRGFYSADVVACLQARNLGLLIPAIRRGRGENDPRGPSGTQPFFAAKTSGFFDYSWSGRHGGPTVTVRVGVHRRPGERPLVFIFSGLKPRHAAMLVRVYRRRFGIESSYRQMHQAFARSASRDARVRLIWAGLALLLRNIWVAWDWAVRDQCGHRRLVEPLRLEDLLTWLTHMAYRSFGLRPEWNFAPKVATSSRR